MKLKTGARSATYLYFGGARRARESEWRFWHDIFHIPFQYDEDDAFISKTERFENTIGAQFPSLQSAGV